MEKVFVTTYALSSGIDEYEVAEFLSENNIRVINSEFYQGKMYVKRGDWFRTKEEAIARAEKKRKLQINALYRRIARMEEIKYD